MVYSLPGIRLPPTVPSVYNSSSSSSRSSSSSVHAADHHRKTTTTNTLSLLRKNSFSPRKNFSGKSSHESESSSFVVAATEKVLVPGSQSDGSSSLKEQFKAADLVLEDPLVSHIEDNPEPEYADTIVTDKKDLEPTSDYSEVDGEKDSVSSPLLGEDDAALGSKESVPLNETISTESDTIRQMSIPPPGTGQRIYEIDPILKAHREHLDYRYGHYKKMREAIDKYEGGLELFSRGYEKFGFIRSDTGVTYREWAPGAKSAALIGDFNNWNPNADIMTRNEFGIWEIFLPNNVDGSPPIPHGSRVKIRMDTPSGIKDSIPAWIKFSVQAPGEIPYNGIYYDPPEEDKYVFQHPRPKKPKSLRIYEAHVGMSSTEALVVA